MTKFCNRCGSPLAANARFCEGCGTAADDGALPQRMGGGYSGSAGGESLLTRFFSFEHLIGRGLIRIIYYLGLGAIALWAVIMLAAGGMVGNMLGGGNLSGISFLIVLIGAPFAAVLWRFWCECAMLLFLLYDRLGEVRDRLPGPAR